MKSISLEYLANKFQCQLVGQGSQEISGLATLENASAGEAAFLANSKYRHQLKSTGASVVILTDADLPHCSTNALIAKDPYYLYAQISQLFQSRPQPEVLIDPSASIDATADIADDVVIGPMAVISAKAKIDSGAVIGAHSFVGEACVIGKHTKIDAQVTLHHEVVVGEACHIQSQTVIGGDGFGFARHKKGWMPVAQLGSVHLGDRVFVGASTTIDRGALSDTKIGNDVIIDNQVQVAHNVEIGDRTAVAGCVGIAGSTRIGADCTIAGQAGIAGHLEITNDVHLGMQAQVTRSIKEAGAYASGTGILQQKEWRKLIASWRRWFKKRQTQALESSDE